MEYLFSVPEIVWNLKESALEVMLWGSYSQKFCKLIFLWFAKFPLKKVIFIKIL